MNYSKENCLLSTQRGLLVQLEAFSLLNCFSICHRMASNLDRLLLFPFSQADKSAGRSARFSPGATLLNFVSCG